MAKGIKPKRFWRDLDELGDRDERQEMVKDATAQTDRELTVNEALEASLLAKQSELALHEGNEPEAPGKVQQDQIRAAVLLAVGIVLETVILLGALPQVSWLWLVLGAIAFSYGASALVRWGFVDHVYDEQRSKRSIRITRLVASITTWVFAGSLAVWLGLRFATGDVAGFVIWAGVGSLYLAAAAVILAGGLYSAAAKMRAHPLDVAHQLRNVQERIGVLRRFIEQLHNLPDEPDGPAGAPVGPLRPKPVGPMTASIVLACIATVAAASQAAAQAPEVRCGASSDVTLSQSVSGHRDALALFEPALSRLVEGCAVLLAGHFADEGAFARWRAHVVPEPPTTRDCSSTLVIIPQHARVVAPFRGAQDYFKRETVDRCQREETYRLKRYEEEDRAFRTSVMAELGVPLLDHATTTDLVGLLEGALSLGIQRLYLVTDGVQSAPGQISSLKIPGGTKVIIFQVPVDSVYGGRESTRNIAREWQAIGVTVVPYTALVVYGTLARSGNRRVP